MAYRKPCRISRVQWDADGGNCSLVNCADTRRDTWRTHEHTRCKGDAWRFPQRCFLLLLFVQFWCTDYGIRHGFLVSFATKQSKEATARQERKQRAEKRLVCCVWLLQLLLLLLLLPSTIIIMMRLLLSVPLFTTHTTHTISHLLPRHRHERRWNMWRLLCGAQSFRLNSFNMTVTRTLYQSRFSDLRFSLMQKICLPSVTTTTHSHQCDLRCTFPMSKKILPLTFQVQERMVFEIHFAASLNSGDDDVNQVLFTQQNSNGGKKCVNDKVFTETVKLKCMRNRFVLKHFFPPLFVEFCRKNSRILSSYESNS